MSFNFDPLGIFTDLIERDENVTDDEPIKDEPSMIDRMPAPDISYQKDVMPRPDDIMQDDEVVSITDDEDEDSIDVFSPITVSDAGHSDIDMSDLVPKKRPRSPPDTSDLGDDGSTVTPEEWQPTLDHKTGLPYKMTDEQRAAADDCIRSKGRLVIANTGWGKSMTIMAVAAHFAHQGKPVLILIRKSTKAQFEKMLDSFEAVGLRRPSVRLMVHETFQKDGENFTNLKTGNVRQSQRLENFMPSGTVVIIDECQFFACATITNATGNPRKMPLVAMNLCHAQASRVYLFSATPCNDHPNELKSLLYLIKRLKPIGGTDKAKKFNDGQLADYATNSSGLVQNEMIPEYDIDPITYNFRCLVSYYMADKSAQHYLKNWVNLVTNRVEVEMSNKERNHFENIERQGGWNHFSAKLRVASQTESKLTTMFEIVNFELHRFNGTQIKPRILIYTYLRDYADQITDALKKHPFLYKTKPVRLEAGQFDVDHGRLREFVDKNGDSYVAVITDAGVTGFNPPPLTCIIAMNAFWSPASRIQLEGRLNRYTRHNFMNAMNVEKTMHVYQLLAVKSKGENAEEERDTLVKSYGYDARQNYVVDDKAAILAASMRDLCRASRIDCSDISIDEQLKSEIVLLATGK